MGAIEERIARQRKELRAPSSWASYLINGDASGLEDGEQAQCDVWIASVGCGDPISCSDAGFCAHHDAWEHIPLAADCQTYIFDSRKANEE